MLEEAHPDDIQKAQFESDHVARAFGEIDAAAERGEPYDVVHDHVGHTALAMADRLSVPLVHTLHGPFTEDACRFYAEHGPKACIVGISQAQLDSGPEEMGGGRVVHNPIDTDGVAVQRRARTTTCSGSAGCRPTRGRTARSRRPARPACGSCSPGPSSRVRSSSSPRRSSPGSGDGIEYVGEADAERKRELYLAPGRC